MAKKRIKQKTGPKPKPASEHFRHAVMVRFRDHEFAALRAKAHPRALSAYVRERVLAS